ncbi:hypothetical protein GW17_00046511, partial [Ensete ventricosum]
MADEGTANCIDIVLAIILPPLGVFLKFGCKVRMCSAVVCMPGGVLDLPVVDDFGLHPRDHLRGVRHNQVKIVPRSSSV